MKKSWTQQDTSSFVVERAKVQFIFPRAPDALCATKRCSWSFRLHPDPKSQHTLEGWTGNSWAGCMETRQSIVCGLILLAGVVSSSYSRVLTKERGLSSPDTELRNWIGWCRIDVRGATLGCMVQLKMLTDASSARAVEVHEGVSALRHVETKVLVDTAEGGRQTSCAHSAWQGQPCRCWHKVPEGRRLAKALRADHPRGRETSGGCHRETTTRSEGNRGTLRNGDGTT